MTTLTQERLPAPPVDRPVTPEELYANPQWGRCELVKGRVIQMSPAGHFHGQYGADILFYITQHVKARKLGRVYTAETGFMFPDGKTVRAPDVMFLSAARVPPDLPFDGFLPVAPDLAVEVVSPADSFNEVTAKAESYLAVGVKLVWVVDPLGRRVYVYRPGDTVRRLDSSATLGGEDVLPGFALPVKALFEG